MEDKMQWFVVNVHTGCEDKVARNLREQIDKRRLNAFFGEILVPTHEVTEIKAGKRVKTEKKFFPGYIVVQMVMNNETFSLVKLMPQVVMFLGARQKPVAVTEEEARRLLKQVEEGSTVPDDMVYEVGQEVHVIDGPFANFNGLVSEVDNVKQKMTVTILVFGRETSVDLEFEQVERV
jgi:transcriptional antiterminator NusG